MIKKQKRLSSADFLKGFDTIRDKTDTPKTDFRQFGKTYDRQLYGKKEV